MDFNLTRFTQVILNYWAVTEHTNADASVVPNASNLQ